MKVLNDHAVERWLGKFPLRPLWGVSILSEYWMGDRRMFWGKGDIKIINVVDKEVSESEVSNV